MSLGWERGFCLAQREKASTMNVDGEDMATGCARGECCCRHEGENSQRHLEESGAEGKSSRLNMVNTPDPCRREAGAEQGDSGT